MMSRYEVFFNDIRRFLTNQKADNKSYEQIQKNTNQNTKQPKKRYAWYSETYFVNRGEEIKFKDMENNTKRASIITYDKSNANANSNTNPNNLTKYNDFILVGEVKEVETICNYNFLNNYF